MWGPTDPKAEAHSGDCTDAVTITVNLFLHTKIGSEHDQVMMLPSADVAVHGLLLLCDYNGYPFS